MRATNNLTGDWQAPNGIWNYGSATASPFNIMGGKNEAHNICDFGVAGVNGV
jgi:hypothetical protein